MSLSKNEPHRPPTIADVARLAGVSPATVSRVLNQSAPVIPETLEKVKVAMAALNYIPSPAARVLAGNKTKTIGLVLPSISEPFFVPLLCGIELSTSLAGYNLLIHTTTHKPDPQQYQMLGVHNTDGLLVFSDSLSNEELAQLSKSGLPMVLIHQDTPPGMKIPSITIENKDGARQIVEHLIKVHGCRRIVHLLGPKGVNDGLWRERGYRQALQENGITYDPELVLPGDFNAARAAASVRELLDRKIVFDAIFSADDGSAFGALSALLKAGLRVPEDVALAGFDDVDFAGHAQPPLTTVRAPTQKVGEEAVRLLLHLIQHETAEEVILLPTQMVLRRSCGCS